MLSSWDEVWAGFRDSWDNRPRLILSRRVVEPDTRKAFEDLDLTP